MQSMGHSWMCTWMSWNPLLMMRCSSSSAAAFEGAQMRIRGFGATFGKLQIRRRVARHRVLKEGGWLVTLVQSCANCSSVTLGMHALVDSLS